MKIGFVSFAYLFGCTPSHPLLPLPNSGAQQYRLLAKSAAAAVVLVVAKSETETRAFAKDVGFLLPVLLLAYLFGSSNNAKAYTFQRLSRFLRRVPLLLPLPLPLISLIPNCQDSATYFILLLALMVFGIIS